MAITTTKIGRRHYLQGNTYPVKDRIKAAGCNWDPERKQWWTAKEGVAQALLRRLSGDPEPRTSSSSVSVGILDPPEEGWRVYLDPERSQPDKRDLDAHLGTVRPKRKIKGYGTVIGAYAEWMTSDDLEDRGFAPGWRAGWYTILVVRPSTPEERAPKEAADRAKESAEEANKQKEDEARKALEAKHDAMLEGFVEIAWPGSIPVHFTGDSVSTERARVTPVEVRGVPCVHLTPTAPDYWAMVHLWGPRDLLISLLDEEIARCNITPEDARKKLASYGRCYGHEVYLRAAGLDPWK